MDKQKLDALITGIANDLKPSVARIEKSLATTQNHYGDYLNLLGTLSNGDKTTGKVIVAALLEAGANHGGVASAYKISFGS